MGSLDTCSWDSLDINCEEQRLLCQIWLHPCQPLPQVASGVIRGPGQEFPDVIHALWHSHFCLLGLCQAPDHGTQPCWDIAL